MKDEFGFDQYCGKPALTNRGGVAGPYFYLCAKHHIMLSDRMKYLYEYNDRVRNQIPLVCPTCGKRFTRKAGYVKASVRSFCSRQCRSRFYKDAGGDFVERMRKARAAKRAKRLSDVVPSP